MLTLREMSSCPSVRNTNTLALPGWHYKQSLTWKLLPLLLLSQEQYRHYVYIRRLTLEINETFEGLLTVVHCYQLLLKTLPDALFISYYHHLYRAQTL